MSSLRSDGPGGRLPGEEVLMAEREVLHVADAAAWEAWLDAHAADSPGVMLAVPKKGSGGAGPSFDEALDAALCFGWIDSRIRRLDDLYTGTTFTPRRSGSSWSASNRAHVARLTAADRMRPAGLAAVERAKASGRWE